MTQLRRRCGAKGVLVLSLTAYLSVQQAATGAPSLLFAETLGGSQTDVIRAIATDGGQNIYVVGETYSADFPGVSASRSRAFGDAFIVKLNSSGTQILYCIAIGGSLYDSARAVAIDPSGNVYVTGVTNSSDFPTTTAAFQKTSHSPGLEESFVVKVDPAGTVVYATFLGGSSSDTGYAIAVDTSGAAYIAGSTNSVNYPVTGNAPQATLKGISDCFISKLDATGSTLVYSTFLGGESIDACKGVAVDRAGAAFVTGTTKSTSFPVVAAFKQSFSGGYDAFLAKISPAGDRFLFSTYLGAEGVDEGNVVRLNSSGDPYVGGDTTSTAFPVSAGVAQGQLSNSYDGFVCGVANDGSRILFATYLGGSGADSITDLFVAQDGRIVVSGYTASLDFPLASPVQHSFGGYFDGFVAVLGQNASTLVLASYIGGGGDDRVYGVAPGGNGTILLAGQVLSGSVAYMPSRFASVSAGQYDGFIAAVSYAQPLRFVPITPCRVADTRYPIGLFGGSAIAGGTSRDFVVPASGCGVPATAQAYSLNITSVPHGSLGYLAVWPSGEARPLVSTLNSADGRVKANAAIVAAGSGGAVSIFVSDTADVALDINGYFVSGNASALAFYPVTPCRVVDTRGTPGALGGTSFVAGQSRTFPVSVSACRLPGSAGAYALNVTAIPKTTLGFLSVWPTGTPRPLVSTLNSPTGVVTANAAVVPAGASGSIDVYATDATDIIVDVSGYFAPPDQNGLSLYVVAPCRVFDSRLQPGAQPITSTMDVKITTSVCSVPAQATAFALNATVIPAGRLNFLSLWPQGQPWPATSVLNSPDGALTSNMAVIPTTTGSITTLVSDPSHIILDISGYFAQ